MNKRPYQPPRVTRHEDLRKITLFTRPIADGGSGGGSDRHPTIQN